MKRITLFAIGALFTICTFAQTNSLKVVTYNVDGLPERTQILNIRINPNCPGNDGTQKAGHELADLDADMIAVQEDFDFHESLVEGLGNSYISDNRWGGKFVLRNTANFRLESDGLGMFMKKDDIIVEDHKQYEWNAHYGGLGQIFANLDDFLQGNMKDPGNGFDDNIKKGFRCYKTTLVSESGKPTIVMVYTLHMDASSDQEDINARDAQWSELAKEVVENFNPNRPVIIMGDFNSRYTREKIKKNFIDVVEEGKKMAVHDAWVETYLGNNYPEYGGNSLMVNELGFEKGELVDKILYINPTGEQYDKIKLKEFRVVDDFMKEETDKDHWPLYAEFTIETNKYNLDRWIWKGEDPKIGGTKEYYINNLATNRFVKPTGEELANDINNGDTFKFINGIKIQHHGGTYLYFNALTDLNVNSWVALADLTFTKNNFNYGGKQCDNCYLIWYNGGNDAYLALQGTIESSKLTKSTQNHTELGSSDKQENFRRMEQANWRFISIAQKCVYNNYMEAIKTAYRYITHFTAMNPEFEQKLLDEIQSNDPRSWDMNEVKDFIILVNSIDDANMAVKEDYLYGTYIAAFDTPVPDGMSAATVTATTSTDLLTLTPVGDNIIPAYTPVVLYKDGGFTSTTYYDVRKDNLVTLNLEKETEEEQVVLTNPAEQYTVGNLSGTLTRLAPFPRTENDNFYLLQKKNGRMAFYRCNPDLSVVYNVGKNRCWLTMNGISASTNSSVKYNTFFLFSDEDETDPIESAIMDKVSSERVYDLSGRMVINPQKGIYIKDGKKVFIKK